jgi:hypothetical protein
MGTCRFNAPSPSGEQQRAVWPSVNKDIDWCADAGQLVMVQQRVPAPKQAAQPMDEDEDDEDPRH